MPKSYVIQHSKTTSNITFSDQWEALLPFRDNLLVIEQFQQQIISRLAGLQTALTANYTVINAFESLPFCEVIIESEETMIGHLLDHPLGTPQPSIAVETDSDSDSDSDDDAPTQDEILKNMLQLIGKTANALLTRISRHSQSFHRSHSTLAQYHLQHIISTLNKHNQPEKFIAELTRQTDKTITEHVKSHRFNQFQDEVESKCNLNDNTQLMDFFAEKTEQLASVDKKASTKELAELKLNTTAYTYHRQIRRINALSDPMYCFNIIQLIAREYLTVKTYPAFSSHLKLFFLEISRTQYFTQFNYAALEKAFQTFAPMDEKEAKLCPSSKI